VTELSHLFVHVSDLSKSKQFYVDQLELAVLMEEPGYLRVGGGDGFHLGLEVRGRDEIGAAGIEIEIRVEDVDAAYDRLSAAGIAFSGPPEDMPWGARHAWLTDPDGYRLSIYSEWRTR
jgi:catechol 2,3-dioxygenase-like lactoylglutathione lyase family enzyme